MLCCVFPLLCRSNARGHDPRNHATLEHQTCLWGRPEVTIAPASPTSGWAARFRTLLSLPRRPASRPPSRPHLRRTAFTQGTEGRASPPASARTASSVPSRWTMRSPVSAGKAPPAAARTGVTTSLAQRRRRSHKGKPGAAQMPAGTMETVSRKPMSCPPAAEPAMAGNASHSRPNGLSQTGLSQNGYGPASGTLIN